MWHSRLRHVNYCSLQRMVNLGLLPNFSVDKRYKCEVYVESKFMRKSFPSMERNSELLDLIHSDLCDKKSTPTRVGKKYFIMFLDDCSKYCYVYLLTSKDETLDVFKAYKVEVENQLEKKVKVLRSDRGGKYELSSLFEFCDVNGIIYQTTALYTSQENGVFERKN